MYSDGAGEWQLELHAHHAIQLTACHDGDLTIVGEGGAVSAPGIAVAADAPHRFEARGVITFLFVEPESAAAREGLRPGMLIRGVGRTKIKNVDDYAEAIKKNLDENGVMLSVRTGGGNRLVVVHPEQG